jgi:hypothetical protein
MTFPESDCISWMSLYDPSMFHLVLYGNTLGIQTDYQMIRESKAG